MMDRKLRAQIIEMLENVKQGIARIEAAPEAAMLEECIAALQSIADICRGHFSAEHYAVYGEVFDGMLSAIVQNGVVQLSQEELRKAAALCQELITFVIEQLQQEKEIKKEIVFLPYKASMWDSLESIWQAAADDKEHCNAYVVPIPYADRNPDMTVKEWHCEANLFPEYVPVQDWQTFDLKGLHPDIIYIHNPYDNYNAATSVDSMFYSSELKKYTDLLVYVPYFVTGNTIEEGFCQAPGVVNADKVIVQNEQIKAQYEKYYPGGNPPKDKFLALGSPKFDKVCNTKREDYVLPEKWQKLIGDRKVILYNTSIHATLRHADSVIDKMNYVFSVFRTRTDVVFWWRPHPLLLATIDSLMPSIAEEYRALVQAYIKDGWGIYDDTPDLHRAISWSDAYYGDPSSVIQLYEVTKKPIAIQNLDGRFLEGNAIDFLLQWKLLNRPREDYALPVDWQQRLQGRKAVLCHFRLESFMEAPAQFMDKLRYLLDAFAHNEQIVFWWRHQEALEQAVQETIPSAYTEYQMICQHFQTAANCICDRTRDEERAILWTDAYYGDMDEAVWQYTTRKRPILLSDGAVHAADASMMPLTAFLQLVQGEEASGMYVESQRMGAKYGGSYLWGRLAAEDQPAPSLLRARREDYPLPEEWLSLIQGKSVLLFQTTSASLITGLEPFVNWMQHVIRIYQNVPDIVLWWNVDASFQMELNNMEKAKQAVYQKLVQEYKEKLHGIYDTTDDIQRMAAWTDAYYGDFAPVMWAYRAQHKPIMLQKVQAENIAVDAFEFLQLFRTMATKKEDLQLPEPWRNIIEGKKVVLYRMTWTNAMEHLDKVNAKLRYVFATFKEHPEIALWWKVDPMIERGMALVAPDLAAEYREIVREYVDEGWGVYDEKFSMGLPIVSSAVYYGDKSSLSVQCELLGRPILIADFQLVKDVFPIEPASLEIDGQQCWFVSRAINSVFNLDLQNGKVSRLACLDTGNVFRDLEYGQVKKNGTKLLMAPFLSTSGFAEYDIETRRLIKVPVRLSESGSEQYSILFYQSVQYDRNTYFIGFEYPALVEYNRASKEYVYYDVDMKRLMPYFLSNGVELVNGIKPKTLFRGIAQAHESLFLPFTYGNLVVEFNLISKKIRYHEVGNRKNRYAKIVYDGKNFWLNQMLPGSPIVRWNLNDNKTIEYGVYPIGCSFSALH